jgi:hypothetical protein
MIYVTVMRKSSARDRAQAGNARRGGIIAWLLICFFMISVLLVMGGILFVRSVRVHESRGSNDVQVDTPLGSVHVSHNPGGTPQTAGMPLYPGAKPMTNHENAVVDLSSIFGDKDLHIVAGRWQSSDSIDKVQKYYEDKYPEMSVIQHTGRVEMHSVNGNGKRVIVLYDRGGSTEISLASVGEPKAN